MCSDCWDDRPKAKYQFPTVDDWEDPRAAHHPRREKKKRPRSPKGCPENGGKAHVYAIIEVRGWGREWNYTTHEVGWVPRTWWEKRCIGCGKVYTKYHWWSYEISSPVGRYFNKEDIYAVETRKKYDWAGW